MEIRVALVVLCLAMGTWGLCRLALRLRDFA